jgi:hypothetical protein
MASDMGIITPLKITTEVLTHKKREEKCCWNGDDSI